MTTLADDYLACEGVLHAARSNFALPIRLLPAAKRRGTTAIYAFCRRADDIVDDSADVDAARIALDAFEAQAMNALAGTPGPDPVLRALADELEV